MSEEPRLSDHYDVVILGTGLKECLLCGLLSVNRKSVLQMDRKGYYGGETASLNIDGLIERFEKDQHIDPAYFEHNRFWALDLVPKFIMSAGKLLKILVRTGVFDRYVKMAQIANSYVYRDGRIHRVPSTPREAMGSKLMTLFEKNRCRKFLNFVYEYKEDDQSTWRGWNLLEMPMRDVYTHFGLADTTVTFLGHSMALYRNDDYLDLPAHDTIKKLQLYGYSVARFGKSPYVYPIYGLGDLPQSYAYMGALYGATQMLGKEPEEVLYDESGHVRGVKIDGQEIATEMVIADHTYFPERCTEMQPLGQVIRAICVLSHPIPNTDDIDSCQIIIPQSEVGRGHDIYVSVLSERHKICKPGCWVATISTTVETDNPHAELEPARALLGPIDYEFANIQPQVEVEDYKGDGVHVVGTYDATSHFETTVTEIEQLYLNISGKTLDDEINEFQNQRQQQEEEAKARIDAESAEVAAQQ